MREGHVYIIPIMHPAAILRGAWSQDPFQPIYLKRAKDISDGNDPSILDPNKLPPGALLDPTTGQMWDWYQAIEAGQSVAVDIEAAGPHITCIGMCRLSDLVAIVFRFRNRGGLPEMVGIETRVEICDLVLSRPDIGLVFQNGQAYDIPQLEASGFVVEGYFDGGMDTMLAAFCAYPDSPKDLEFLACIYGGLSKWKHTVKAEGGENK
tara:strand:- start:584 stop:1207 length:624 start_codon:yes stop_codon:yes gene_type:complete